MLIWLRYGPTIGVYDMNNFCPFFGSYVIYLSGSLAFGGRSDFDGLI